MRPPTHENGLKRHFLRTVTGVVVVVLFLAHAREITRMPLVDRLELLAYDMRLRLTMPRTVDDRVVILDIDEKSVQEKEFGGEGRWPWPRDRLALIMDRLFDKYGVAVVGFDVVFAERDSSSGLRALEALAQDELKEVSAYQAALRKIRPSLDFDALFARKLEHRKVVTGYYFSDEPVPPTGQLPAPVLRAQDLDGRRIPGKIARTTHAANLPELQRAAASGGHFNPIADEDGIARRVPVLLEHKGAFYEPLSVAVVRLMLGSPPVRPVFVNELLEEFQVGPFTIPVDREWNALVPYRGGRASFKYHSMVDVIHERVAISELKGKIALIGTTAPGIFDLRATPVEAAYPGVEIHANLIAGILDERIKHQPPDVGGWEFLLLLAAGLVMVFVQPRFKFAAGMITVTAVLAVAIGANIAVFHYRDLVLPLASSVSLIFALFTFNMAYGFFVEGAGKRAITARFGEYVPPEIAEEMAEAAADYGMEGESREMTVLFTDVRGFTSISEGLDPKTLSKLMNEFLTPLTEVIFRHRGTIDKYMGDCIMAFWGAPVANPAHARYGVLAALEMQRTLKGLQPEFRAKDWPEIRIGVGLNTGRMSVGNMGSKRRRAYTVMGDAVNLASRLEGLTKQYGTDIIVGESTRDAVPEVFFRELDRVRVKGKEVAVAIFEPLGLAAEVGTAARARASVFHEALGYYRSRNWDEAVKRLTELQLSEPGTALYGLFLDRIAFLRANPPGADWDGAFTFENK
jgi:adenylate cyclase